MKSVKINGNNQIVINSKKNKLVGIDQIIMLKSVANYTRLYLINGEYDLTTLTLKLYENVLFDKGFVRVHRSCLVNKAYIERQNYQNSVLTLANGHVTGISRRQNRKIKGI